MTIDPIHSTQATHATPSHATSLHRPLGATALIAILILLSLFVRDNAIRIGTVDLKHAIALLLILLASLRMLLRPPVIQRALVIFALGATLAGLLGVGSTWPATPLTITFAIWFGGPLLALAISVLLPSRQLPVVLFATLIGTAVVALLAIPGLTPPSGLSALLYSPHGERATGLFPNPNTTALVLMLGTQLTLLFAYISRSRLTAIATLLTITLAGTAIFFTGSRVALVLFLLLLFISALMILPTRLRPYLTAAFVLLLPLLAGPAHNALASTRLGSLGAFPVQDQFRFSVLLDLVTRLPAHLLSGSGTNTFGDVFAPLHPYIQPGKSPHNLIIGLWTEWGLLALLLTLFGMAALLLPALRPASRKVRLSALGLLTAFLFHQFHLVFPLYYFIYIGLYGVLLNKAHNDASITAFRNHS